MSRDVCHQYHPDQDDWDETGPEYVDDEATTSHDEGQKDGASSVWDDGTSHTEPDSLGHDSDLDDDDENDKGVDELDDLSSDGSSLQEADSQGEITGDDNDG
jgi:hypothetical protein